MFGRKKLMWVAQGGDSLWGVRMAAIHDYYSHDCHARLQQLSQAKDFYDQTRCSCLIGATGSPWTKQEGKKRGSVKIARDF
jgi:predicted adenine nucleotide alpha hydrolase (AANH) superfamily ATPase